MSTASSGRAAFKKTDGVIAITSDGLAVTWAPNPGTGPPTVSLLLVNISNLQQTPDSNPKVMLKILAKATAEAEQAESFVFNFNTPDGRAEANAIKDIIARRINELRTNDPAVPKLAPTKDSAAAPVWLDDARLKNDIELQHSLMKQDKDLHQKYMATHSAKPDSISDAAFNTQFWSTRTDLLRSHSIETSQRKGAYHVLSVVKPKVVENELKLNINIEQVQLILAQHPLVKRLYDENVPRMSEKDFWSNFFMSRLRKRLCGEEVLPTDKAMPLFDRPEYESVEALSLSNRDDVSVPHTIDVGANEENQGGFRGGNMKDVEMRVRKKAPIIGIINSISERIISGITFTDEDPDRTATDEDTIRELSLRDLAPAQDENRIMLNIKEQRGMFSGQDAAQSTKAAALPMQSAGDIMTSMMTALSRLPTDSVGGIDLHAAIGFNDQSDSEDETPRAPHLNSRAALQTAQAGILAGITRRRNELYGAEDDSGLSPELMERVALTNASTTEFLRQFWDPFLSGDAERATELQYAVEALQRSEERIEATAVDAERERDAVITQKKKDVRAYFEKTGKKVRWNTDMVRGGRREVEALLSSALGALKVAQKRYKRAYDVELAQQVAEGE